jgi:hypothetical protein
MLVNQFTNIVQRKVTFSSRFRSHSLPSVGGFALPWCAGVGDFALPARASAHPPSTIPSTWTSLRP